MWFGVWDCGCSDVQEEAGQVPTVCPGHNRPLIYGNDGNAIVEVPADHHPELGHECSERIPCSAMTTTKPASGRSTR